MVIVATDVDLVGAMSASVVAAVQCTRKFFLSDSVKFSRYHHRSIFFRIIIKLKEDGSGLFV
jgi:hypothetical protein